MFQIPSEVDRVSIHVWHNHDLTLYAGETVIDTVSEDQPRYKTVFKAIGPWRVMEQVGEFDGYIYLRRPLIEESRKHITLRRHTAVTFTLFADNVAIFTIQRECGKTRSYWRRDGQRLLKRLELLGRIPWTYQQHSATPERSWSYLRFDLPVVCSAGCGCPDCQIDENPNTAMGGGNPNAPIQFGQPVLNRFAFVVVDGDEIRIKRGEGDTYRSREYRNHPFSMSRASEKRLLRVLASNIWQRGFELDDELLSKSAALHFYYRPTSGGGSVNAPIIFVSNEDKAPAMKVIQRTVTLSCNVHRAFSMFTQAHLAQAWLTPCAVIKPVLGGRYDLTYDVPRATGSTITAIEPNKLLSFSWAALPQFSFMDMTPVTITFEEIGSKMLPETLVTFTHAGWQDAPEWDAARRWYEEFWGGAFRRLYSEVRLLAERRWAGVQ